MIEGALSVSGCIGKGAIVARLCISKLRERVEIGLIGSVCVMNESKANTINAIVV